MILQVKKKTITRGEGTSTHHQAPHVCTLWHGVTKKPIPSDSDNDSDDELPSYDEIMEENLNFAKVCTSQQKKKTI